MMRVSIVLVVALGVDALLRRRSAAARHWVLAVAMLAAAATPLFERTLPSWRLPVDARHLAWTNASEVDIDVEAPGRPSTTTARSAPTTVQSSYPARLGAWLAPIWLAGLALGLLTLATGLLRLRWLAMQAEPLTDGPWVAHAGELARALGIQQPVRVLQSRQPGLLVTWGHRRPRILLPDAARTWTPERARVVLAHELAHIKRRDWAVQIGAALLRTMYWFNPLAWLAASRLRQHSEHACDDVVLASGIDSSAYAAHLLAVARTLKARRLLVPELPAPAIARPSNLERRIDAMLKPHLDRAPLTRTARVAASASFVVVVLLVASFVMSAQGTTAKWTGTLVDQVGRIMPETAMELVNQDSQAKYSLRSDPIGHFELADIPAGVYQLKAGTPGFAIDQGRFVFEAGQTLQRDVALQVGSLEETILVTEEDTPTSKPLRRIATLNKLENDVCAQSTVGGCIRPPLRLADVRPVYPSSARESKASGTVVLEGRVGTDGLLKDLRVQSPVDAALAASAFDAVRQWEFSATHLDGIPIEVPISVHVHFRATQ